jgi:WD40 repeat protein
MNWIEWDVFISHASEDKDAVARPLAATLAKAGVKVWLDEHQLRLGDSLREKIDQGLASARFGIVILSKAFFLKEWPQRELNGLVAREVQGTKVILPVWHEVDHAFIARYSPTLADKLGVQTNQGLERVTNAILDVLRDHLKDYKAPVSPKRTPVPRGSELKASSFASEVTLPSRGDIWAYAFSPSIRRTLTGGEDTTIRLWDLETGRCECILEGHSAPVYSLVWSADNRRALSGSADGTLRLWNVETGRCLRVMKGHRGWIRNYVKSVAWNVSHDRAISGGYDSTVRLWDLETGDCVRTLTAQGVVWAVALSSNGRVGLSGDSEGTVQLWDVELGRCLHKLKGHTGFVRCVAFSSDHQRALSASDDNTLRLWDLETGSCIKVLEGHPSWVHTVAWGPGDRCAMSGGEDGSLRLWEGGTGEFLYGLKGNHSRVFGVGWSADQRHAFSGDVNGRIHSWDLSEFIPPKITN